MFTMQKTIKEHILAAAASFGEAVASSDLVEEAVRRTGTSEATVRNQLTDLKRRGLLIQPRHGYYQLPATSEIKELIKKEEGTGGVCIDQNQASVGGIYRRQ